ncbi:hypothetical protein HK102_001861, partial [Quaeritorhiza haematococci]
NSREAGSEAGKTTMNILAPSHEQQSGDPSASSIQKGPRYNLSWDAGGDQQKETEDEDENN